MRFVFGNICLASTWATVCKTVHGMLSVRCLSCLSVTFVHCGQTVERIKMKLGKQVGLGPGHIVLDGDPAPPPSTGAQPPIFGPYLLRPNGCMDQDLTCYRARPQPRRLCVRWGPRSRSPPQNGGKVPLQKISAHVYCGQTARWMKLLLGMVVGLSPGAFVLDGDPAPFPKKGGRAPSPIFGPFLLWPNGWMHQDAIWYGCRPQSRGLCVRWRPNPLPKKGAEPPTPQIFGPCLLWQNGGVDEDATWHDFRPHPRQLCVRWGPSPLPTKGVEPPSKFSAHFYCGQTAGRIKMPLGMEVGLRPGDFVLDGDPAPFPKGHSPTKFPVHVYCDHRRPSQLLLSSCCLSNALDIPSNKSKKTIVL